MPDTPPPYIPIRSLQHLQGCFSLPSAHHLQGCTPLQFIQRCLAYCLLAHPPVSKNSGPPGSVQFGSTTEHCSTSTRDWTQISCKFKHQSHKNSHACSANIMPDHAPWTILPTHKTLLIPTNSQPGHPGRQGRPCGWSSMQHPQSDPGPNNNSGSRAGLYLQLWWSDYHDLPHSTTSVPLQYAPHCPWQNHGPPHGNGAPTGEPQVQGTVGKSYTKKPGRLAQGIPGVSKGTNAIAFIQRKDIPNNRKCNVTYAWVCVNYHPEKEDPNHTLVTVGGNLLHYPSNCGTPTVNMITVKLHLNSIISTKNAHYCTCRRPLAQPRGSTMRNERAVFRWTKATVEGNKKGSA